VDGISNTDEKHLELAQEDIVEDLQKKVGTEGKPVRLEIEKCLVRRYVEAVGDNNPLWQDEEYARGTSYGGIIAPPWLLCALMATFPTVSQAKTLPSAVPEVTLPRERVLDGGGEWEFSLPLRLGDTITARTKLGKVFEREGRIGKMLFFVYETKYTNQRGELVARSSSTLINY
jgi:acyl dehydratase